MSYSIELGDTVTVTLTVTNKNQEKQIIELDCHCTRQDGKTAISALKSTKLSLKSNCSPTSYTSSRACEGSPESLGDPSHARDDVCAVNLKNPKTHWYHQLMALKNSLSPLITAVVHPVDELSLQGAIASAEAGLITPILIGPKQKIIDTAKAAKMDISPYQIISTQHSTEAAEVAVNMAKTLQVEALMKGKLHTDELMKAILDKEKGLRTGRRMSHVFSLEVPNYPKPLFLTDAAINLFPRLQEKQDIVQNAIDLFRALGLGTPNVAILSAVETVNEKIPSTLDATALCKMAERGQITGGILDGPLAFDNAISVESARVKGLTSPVAGHADIIVVPDVESGNMLYKQMTYLSGVEAAGIVLGATVPIILTSRGSDELSRKASSAMALLYVRREK